jgi:hypothetical protein
VHHCEGRDAKEFYADLKLFNQPMLSDFAEIGSAIRRKGRMLSPTTQGKVGSISRIESVRAYLAELQISLPSHGSSSPFVENARAADFAMRSSEIVPPLQMFKKIIPIARFGSSMKTWSVLDLTILSIPSP